MKKYLITGLLIWIPLVITLWVLNLVVTTLDQVLLLLPNEFRTENWLGLHVPGMGVILTLAIVLITGVLAANFIGARLVHLWHEILHRIPVVNSIYSSVKQVSDTLFSSGGQAFRKHGRELGGDGALNATPRPADAGGRPGSGLGTGPERG